MARSNTRTYLVLFAIMAAILSFAAFGGTAFGAPGDSAANATLLNDYLGSSLTTRLAAGSIAGTGTAYYFRVELQAGETLRANFTSADISNLKVLVLPYTPGYRIWESSALTPNLTRLTFMAPTHTMYTIYLGASSQGTFHVVPELIPPLQYVPIAGSTRYDTAVQISKKAFSSAGTVVVTNGLNWPDALGGAALTNATNGPILLTDPNALPSSVNGEITRLGATKAVILGGTGSVSTSVENVLKSKLGSTNVTRIGGKSRYETASLIASETASRLGGSYDGWAFVTTGGNFPDALAASPLAAAKGWPIFLSGPTGLDQSTLGVMSAKGVTHVVILGGTGAVSSAVENDLKTRLGAGNVLREQGATRYSTAVAVATFGVEQCGLAWDKLALTTGLNFPDALAGGVLQGRDDSVVLLTPPTALDSSVSQLLAAERDVIDVEVRYLGGTGSVSQAVRNAVAAVLR